MNNETQAMEFNIKKIDNTENIESSQIVKEIVCTSVFSFRSSIFESIEMMVKASGGFTGAIK